MRIKKYKAPSLKSGKDKVLEELGEDAVILSTRTVRSTSPNEPDYIEIVAATDDKPVSAPTHTLKKETITIQNALKAKEQENEMLFSIQKIQDDINELKSLVSVISDSVRYKYSSNFNGEMERLYKYMRQEGFSDDTTLKTIGQISTAGLADNMQKAVDKAKGILTRNITTFPPLKKEKGRKICFFMGPTGSGKTSSLVKLAIISKLINKTDALIISADTDKVGGADQLQTFATIAGIAFETAYTPKELRELLDKEVSREMIFIDTTGKSQNNADHLKELNVFLESSKPDYRFLVISCTTEIATFKQTLEKFEKLKPSGLIVTKFDEAASIGSTMEMLKDAKFPLAYFTNGQKIPEDIEPASKEFLQKAVFRNLEF